MVASRFRPRTLAVVLQYVVSVVVLGWLATRVEWARFAELGGLDRLTLLLAIGCAGVAYPLQAWRWQVLLQTQAIRPGVRWVHGTFWIGNFFNAFLPGGVAGDALRFWWLAKLEPARKAGAAASLVVDRLLGLGTLCALAVAGLAAHLALVGRAPGLTRVWIAAAVALIVLAAVAWVGGKSSTWAPLARRWLGTERAEALAKAADALGCARGALWLAVGLSLAVWAFDFVSLWLLAMAAGVRVSLWLVALAACVAYAAAALPISIGGHGVREAAFVGTLALLHVGSDEPVGMAVLALAFWAVTVGWSLVGGGVYAVALATGWPVDCRAEGRSGKTVTG